MNTGRLTSEGDKMNPIKPRLCPQHRDQYCWAMKSLAGACPLCWICVEEFKAQSGSLPNEHHTNEQTAAVVHFESNGRVIPLRDRNRPAVALADRAAKRSKTPN
jgi:hypothetical protein